MSGARSMATMFLLRSLPASSHPPWLPQRFTRQRNAKRLQLPGKTPFALLLVGDSCKFIGRCGEGTAVTVTRRIFVDIRLLAALPGVGSERVASGRQDEHRRIAGT